jgi:hypothetical protein
MGFKKKLDTIADLKALLNEHDFKDDTPLRYERIDNLNRTIKETPLEVCISIPSDDSKIELLFQEETISRINND